MYKDFLLEKLTKKEIASLFTFNLESAKSSLVKPGISDKKDLPKGENISPYIVVFRHGQSTDNIKRIFSGWRDPHLTKEGEFQAKQLAPKLENYQFNYYFCSDQIRSMDTLRLAMGERKFTPIVDWRLKERSYGIFMGKSKNEAMSKNLLLAVLLRRSWEYSPPNGESTLMVYYRVLPFLKMLELILKKENANAVISCSGNSMRAIRAYFENLTPDKAVGLENPTGQDFCLYNIK